MYTNVLVIKPDPSKILVKRVLKIAQNRTESLTVFALNLFCSIARLNLFINPRWMSFWLLVKPVRMR